MAPGELQGTVLEHADRLREYRQMKEKMVMLLDARGQLEDPNAMDIGYSGEEDWTWDTELRDFDVGAVGRSDHCYRCGGMGHIANECPTPKGKGKGKEDRSFCAKDKLIPEIHVDYCFMGSKTDVATKCIVVEKDYSSKSVMASVVPVKGASNEFPTKRINAFVREWPKEEYRLLRGRFGC